MRECTERVLQNYYQLFFYGFVRRTYDDGYCVVGEQRIFAFTAVLMLLVQIVHKVRIVKMKSKST